MSPRPTSGIAVLALNALALGCLAALHVLSPEFVPSWRMVSEYARGHWGGVLSVMFLAGYLGILPLPVAALLVHRGLARAESRSRASLVWVALPPVASLVVFAASFVVLIATYSASGATVDPEAVDISLPEGVIAFVGWANRALVVAFLGWASVLAWRALVRSRGPEGTPA